MDFEAFYMRKSNYMIAKSDLQNGTIRRGSYENIR